MSATGQVTSQTCTPMTLNRRTHKLKQKGLQLKKKKKEKQKVNNKLHKIHSDFQMLNPSNMAILETTIERKHNKNLLPLQLPVIDQFINL